VLAFLWSRGPRLVPDWSRSRPRSPRPRCHVGRRRARLATRPACSPRRPGEDVRALVGLQVGRIQEQVRKAGVAERSIAEGPDVLVELGADARDLGLGDAGVDAERAHQVVDLAGAHSMHVGLHHDRPQGPVDAPAWLQQRGEERARSQLGDPQLEVAGFGREQPLAVAVAMGRPLGAALVGSRSDLLGGLHLDQGLQHQLQPRADKVEVAAGAKRIQQLREGRLIKGHRVLLASTCEVNAEVHPVALSVATGSGNHTTRRDVSSQSTAHCRDSASGVPVEIPADLRMLLPPRRPRVVPCVVREHGLGLRSGFRSRRARCRVS
jgi:hypothetical protein